MHRTLIPFEVNYKHAFERIVHVSFWTSSTWICIYAVLGIGGKTGARLVAQW